MKNLLEKFVLAFLYLFTIGSCIRMYADLVLRHEQMTAGVVFHLFVVGLCLVFLSVVSFVLLFTKQSND